MSVGELEGENSVGYSTVKPASTATEADSCQDDKPLTPPQMASIPVPETPRIQRICKPSQYVCDLQSIGSTTGFANHSAIPEGLQVPVGKSQQRDEDIEEVTLVVDVGDVEPLEPKKWQPDWPNWECRIREELKTLEDSGTWGLTDTPPHTNIIGSKWLFRLKHNATCHIVCYKVRLVMQGFSQVEGVNYLTLTHLLQN